jgi:hypothetical protein
MKIIFTSKMLQHSVTLSGTIDHGVMDFPQNPSSIRDCKLDNTGVPVLFKFISMYLWCGCCTN